MAALCSTGKRMLEGASGSAPSEPLLKKRSSGLDAHKPSPACSNVPQPAFNNACVPGMPSYGNPSMGQPMTMHAMSGPMSMGYMAPMAQPQLQQMAGSASPAMGVPSMMPPTPAPGFGFPSFMPPPFMMMWMQQMAMHAAMACTMQKMHAQAHAQPGTPASGSAAAALAPLPYPMVMGAYGSQMMMPSAMQHGAMQHGAMQPHAMPIGMCQPQPQQACAAAAAAPDTAADGVAAVPTPTPTLKVATAPAPVAPKLPTKLSKAGAKGGSRGGAKASNKALAKACSSSLDSEVSGGDTLLDVDFASFIDSFLLTTPGSEGEGEGGLMAAGQHCLAGEEQGGADQVDLSDSMLVTSDCHPLALSPLDDCVMDLLAVTTH